MSGKATSEEKILPPSAKKLREARKKGQIARSREMTTAMVFIAASSYLFARAASVFDSLADIAMAAGAATESPFAAATGQLAARLWQQLAWTVGPFVGLLVAAAMLTSISVNGGALAALDPVLPKMERIDPVEGFKRLFAMRNLVELIKSVLKVAMVGVLAGALIVLSLQAMVEQPHCGLGCAGPLLRALLKPLLIGASLFFVVLGGLDIGLQRWLFLRDMRMTKSEQKRERKEMEGDPIIKSQQRLNRQAGLRLAVKTGLRNATFIVRSADLALAFRFAKPDALVPVLVARSEGEGADPLLDEARAARIPVVSDSLAARTFAGLRVGQMVDSKHFQLVIACMRQAGVM